MRLPRRNLLTSFAFWIVRAAVGSSGLRPAAAGDALPGRGGAGPLPLVADKAMPDDGGSALSFDGTAAGPVLRIVKGATLDLRIANRLDRPIALQFHGLRAPNAVEGDWPLAGVNIAPGATMPVAFVPPDSGVYWLHPAALPGEPDLTARGLRAVLIVEEPQPPIVDRDALVTLADRSPATGQHDPLLVNGRTGPEAIAMISGGRLRLRVLNASTARILILAIEGARPLILAIDGQPSELFEPVKDSVPVGPGARFEFMIDLPRRPDALVRLLLRGGQRAGEAPEPDRALLEVRTTGAPRDPLPPIAALPRNLQLSPAIPLEQSVRADLTMEAVEGAGDGQPTWRLNGVAALTLSKAPLLTVKKGGTVTLGLMNKSAVPVALRVHGHVMRLLHGKDDGWEPYWRDSVLLPPNTVNHVAFIADNPGKWLIESAIFTQAALGLRSWFVVA